MSERVQRESEQLANEGTALMRDGKLFPFVFLAI